jgi:anti-anti-sigma regulatory factor
VHRFSWLRLHPLRGRRNGGDLSRLVLPLTRSSAPPAHALPRDIAMLSVHPHFRWPPRAARGSSDVPGGPGAGRQALGSIICLRLNCELSADIAGALSDAVSARLAAAAAPTGTVVLDLSAAETVDDLAWAALQSLHRRLADLTIRLRLVAPEANVSATLQTGGIGIGPDAFHTSVRTAVLAAYADLPGPASVTPARRMLLTQPPELLSLAEVPGSSDLTKGVVVSGARPARRSRRPPSPWARSRDLGGPQ